MSDYSIVPPTGAVGTSWFKNNVLQHGRHGSLSAAGWTLGNEGFVQQTFLGASIRDWNMVAGFGDTSSTLSVNLVDDEFNNSDGAGLGEGDDAYHNGEQDIFRPPACGSPVFFKFGTNPATVEQAFRRTFDEIYGYNTLNAEGFREYEEPKSDDFTLPDYNYIDLEKSTDTTWTIVDKSPLFDPETEWRGKDHMVFGGVLQSYVENVSVQGQGYSITCTDPREILQNAVIILNNYQGTTFNNKNLLNLYGFLEYDPGDELQRFLDQKAKTKSILGKFINPDGTVVYQGTDQYIFPGIEGSETSHIKAPGRGFNTNLPRFFPITGQGYGRRSPQGMPFYRIEQALVAMFEYYGGMPQEYLDAGFGGRINFRGYNYVVDFGGLPSNLIPQMYFMDFDQIDLLSFAQEICDIISHELFVQLLPIIDHPACKQLEQWNQEMAKTGNESEMVAGIIRVDAISKTKQPEYGAILKYITDITEAGYNVTTKDIGFELSNVVTDKFVVGAQEVEMYYFENNKDRDDLQVRRGSQGQGAVDSLRAEQWLLETGLKQQILPFYGFIGDNNAVSIPRGFGSYQQILLDATSLNAFGVGNYYIATEMELRAALISYDRWKNFLLKYNETYIQDMDPYQATWAALGQFADGQINSVLNNLQNETGIDEDNPLYAGLIGATASREYGVTVPRCVWNSDRPYMGEDGYPASPCSPPFGYPLYYKRATKIGIPEGGVTALLNAKTRVLTNTVALERNLNNESTYTDIHSEGISRQRRNIDKKIQKYIDNHNIKFPNDQKNGGIRLRRDPTYVKLQEIKKQVEERIKEFEQIEAQLLQEGKNLIAYQSDVLQDVASNPIIKSLPTVAKISLENAQKVYEFVKKVAEENLGKKFLVKIPKSCNLRYQPTIATYDNRSTNIAAGPFGFPPQPVNNDYAKMQSDVGNAAQGLGSNDLFTHYCNQNINLADGSTSPLGSQNNSAGTYSNGALKTNYNPITDNWEFNYKPESQGGFFNFALFNQNISVGESLNSEVDFGNLPPATQAALCPQNVESITDDNGRIFCYARYDNSQYLNFANVNPSDMSQQVLTDYGDIIPDIIQSLPNLRADQKLSFNTKGERDDEDANALKQPASVAYVKCQIDEEFYMPPKLQSLSVNVFAREYEMYLCQPQYEIEETLDAGGCPDFVLRENRIEPVFSVPLNGGADGTVAAHTDFVRYFDPNLNGFIIDSYKQNLDSNHVYALVTVPGRIQATVDQRWADGPMMAMNTADIKNIMTQDVVKIPAFAKPGFPERKPISVDCNNAGDLGIQLTYNHITEAQRIQRQALKGIQFNQGDLGIQWIQPSPVYPSMVAIPLLSYEKCYGPWLSSTPLNSEEERVRYSNLGGKVEFVKDENLAPWNFAGYQLMNEAGRLQADFSNSLLLITERGSFTYAGAPTGVSIARELENSGPLVTSISVSVGNEVTTTVKLDIYTPQFGKLQKQKELAVSTVARERQKIIDRTNNAIRRGLGKGQSSTDLLGGIMKQGGQALVNMANRQQLFIEETRRRPAAKYMEIMNETGDAMSEIPEAAFLDGVNAYDNLADIQSNSVRGSIPASQAGRSKQIGVQQPVGKEDNAAGTRTSQLKAMNKRIDPPKQF